MNRGWVLANSSSGLGHLVQRLPDAAEHIPELRRRNDQRRTEAHRFGDVARDDASLQRGVGDGQRGVAGLGIRPRLDLQRADQADAPR
jgi:hypothetical protein